MQLSLLSGEVSDTLSKTITLLLLFSMNTFPLPAHTPPRNSKHISFPQRKKNGAIFDVHALNISFFFFYPVVVFVLHSITCGGCCAATNLLHTDLNPSYKREGVKWNNLTISFSRVGAVLCLLFLAVHRRSRKFARRHERLY